MGRIYREEDDSGFYGDGGVYSGPYSGPATGTNGVPTGSGPGGYTPPPPRTPTSTPSTPPATTGSSPMDFWQMYQDYMSRIGQMQMPNASQYFNPGGINRMYDTAGSNIRSNMYSAQSRAANQAGALAGSRNLLNPGGFTMNATSTAGQPYVQALQQNETARAGSLQANQGNLYNALMGQSVAQAGFQQQGIGNVFQMMNQGYNQQNLDLERQRLAQQGEQFGKTYDLARFTQTVLPMFQKQWQDFITGMQQEPGADKLDWGKVYQGFMEQMGMQLFGTNNQPGQGG